MGVERDQFTRALWCYNDADAADDSQTDWAGWIGLGALENPTVR